MLTFVAFTKPNMLQLPKIINKTLSVRLSLIVVFSMAILLMASLTAMLHYSRKAIKEEALHKASQTLEGTVQRIDNILLSVEQTMGNIYFNMYPYLNQPDMMFTCCRELIEANPYVTGCAVAFKPYYYPDRELFMAYMHRSDRAVGDSIVVSESFGDTPYTEQLWFTRPMETKRASWLNPLFGMDVDMESLITFCLPIFDMHGNVIGVIGADVSLNLLSSIVAEAKPSENSYCMLLDSDGSFIVRPENSDFFQQSAFTISDNMGDVAAREAVQAMTSGETGYKFFRLDGLDYYGFYKPYNRNARTARTVETVKWSAAIIYPADDILGDYKKLSYYVLAIAVVGLLLLFLLSRTIIHRQVKPLLMLTDWTQRIAKGNYNDGMLDNVGHGTHHDEIGRLQENFRQMQQSLSANIGELESLKTTLVERGKGLRSAYDKAQQADRMKMSFLHNMTNQMIAPADAIDEDVNALCNVNSRPDKEEIVRLADDIQQKGNTIADLLNNLINMSEAEMRKEVAHD